MGLDVDLIHVQIIFFCTIEFMVFTPVLTPCVLAGHHAFELRAVLGAVNALRIRFDRAFRAAFGH